MNGILVESSTSEVLEYKERTYKMFLYYYTTTNLKINEIYKLLGFNNQNNQTVKYIVNRLRKEGYNSLKRAHSIKKGEWI